MLPSAGQMSNYVNKLLHVITQARGYIKEIISVLRIFTR